MGAWGPGIFSNDLAADVRAEWRERILAGEDASVEHEAPESIRRWLPGS
jgi:hypothetical protein